MMKKIHPKTTQRYEFLLNSDQVTLKNDMMTANQYFKNPKHLPVYARYYTINH